MKRAAVGAGLAGARVALAALNGLADATEAAVDLFAEDSFAREYTLSMESFVYSRAAIELVPPHDVPHVIISITSATDDVARIPHADSCRGILRLSFADVDVAAPGMTLFSTQHAVEILDFVFVHRGSIERLVVHCDAGISRSPGVAAALARILGDDAAEFFQRYRPNARVYRTLVETFEREREARGWV